jgi:predicted translin family RNA/ssDNA-binding protein
LEAAILAAAQAQDAAKEEITLRFPHNVLNIQRCLDQQQSLVDKTQAEISTLTDMVA